MKYIVLHIFNKSTGIREKVISDTKNFRSCQFEQRDHDGNGMLSIIFDDYIGVGETNSFDWHEFLSFLVNSSPYYNITLN